MRWQPIETAPQLSDESYDAEIVLVWVADGGHGHGNGSIAFGRCYKLADGSTRSSAIGFYGNWKITHWMPLPAPPSPTSTEDKG